MLPAAHIGILRPADAPTMLDHCPQNRPRCTPHRPTSRRRSARVQKMVFPHNIRNADSLPTENGQYPVICFLREFRLGDAPKRDPREGTCGFPGAVLVLNVVRAYKGHASSGKGHDSSGRSGRCSRSIERVWISRQTFIANSSQDDSVGFQPRFSSRTDRRKRQELPDVYCSGIRRPRASSPSQRPAIEL